jgi:hypothetical protein
VVGDVTENSRNSVPNHSLKEKNAWNFATKKRFYRPKTPKSFFFLFMTLVKSLYTALIKSRNKASSAAEFVG